MKIIINVGEILKEQNEDDKKAKVFVESFKEADGSIVINIDENGGVKVNH